MGVLLFRLAVLGTVMTVCRFVRSSPGILSQLSAGAKDGNMKALSTGSTDLCSTGSKVPWEVGLGSSLKAHFAEGSGRERICRAEGTVDADSCFPSHTSCHTLQKPPRVNGRFVFPPKHGLLFHGDLSPSSLHRYLRVASGDLVKMFPVPCRPSRAI